MKLPFPSCSGIVRSIILFVHISLLACGVMFIATVLLVVSPLPVAVEVKRMLGPGSALMPILLVSSPEHLRRAVLTFQSVGFKQVGSYAALDTYDAGDYLLNPVAVDDTLPLPSMENNLVFRYHLWMQMEQCVESLRELVSLGYYRLKGWI